MICQFNKAWIGKCGTPCDGERCTDHAAAVCCSCGAPATRECYETGQFVCGENLCGDCEHTTFPDGTNGGVGFNAAVVVDGMKRHCKKTEQNFSPWYMRDKYGTSGQGAIAGLGEKHFGHGDGDIFQDIGGES